MREKTKYLKYLLIILLIIVLGVIYIVGKGKKETNKDQNKGKATTAEATTEEIKEKTDGTETFLIFGVDTREKNLGKGTRSDSIMVVDVNHKSKEIRLASIFRDTYVSIEDHGLDKINHAHSFGGPDLAMDTVNRNFDLDIDKYITINFMNVSELVDDIGGIEMEITDSEAKYINGYIDELNKIEERDSEHITKAGTYTLDGVQAVAYTRIRYTAGGDYKRAERQRTILFKIFEKAKTLESDQLLDLADKFLDEISTNYHSDDVTEILYYLAKYDIVDTKAFPTSLWGGKIDGVWYGVPVTLESNARELHEFLYPKEDYEPSDTVEEISNRIRQVADTPNEVFEDEE
ncbi:MAG: LCP family protein [Anaerostipes sp.]|nr:LCP family protein [Anaerostipes sp.]